MIIPEKIQELIKNGALFVINDSAGKDSQAMKILLLKNIPHKQLIIVHANLPEVEWDGNMEHIKRYSEDVPVFEVQAGKTFFEMVEHRGKFPSASCRQCTSDLKRGPIQKLIRNYSKDHGFHYVVNCMGMRAQESTARSKKPVLKFNKRESCGHREQYDWLPIHKKKENEVFKIIADAGQEVHYAYKLGMSRLSCCFCILAKDADLKIASKAKPALAWRYIETEERLDFTMSMSRRPLKEIIGF